ncbi:hypothetical protein GCM10020331_035400 [Ectobacillus funiculus]
MKSHGTQTYITNYRDVIQEGEKGENSYCTKKGDTLYKIANKYGVELNALKKARMHS